MTDLRERTKPATRAASKEPDLGTDKNHDKRHIDVFRALSLKAKGVQQSDIARVMGVGRQAISELFRRIGDLGMSPDQEQQFDNLRISMWKGAELKLLRTAMDTSKLKKAPLAALMMGAGISFDKVRILEGKSTANVFHGVMVTLQREALESGIKITPPKAEEAEPSTVVSVSKTDEESGS